MSTTTFSPLHPTSKPATPFSAPAIKRKSMGSITQTYYLAHKARAKLSGEAARPDHDLRLLVGHANLLDSLMVELADAEREQESWFNQSVRNATQQQKKQDRHIQWADSVVEEPEEDWNADDADSDSSSDAESDFDDDEDVEMADVVSLRRMPSNHVLAPSSPKVEVLEIDMEMDMDDDDEDYAQLGLTRTSSHSPSSPPQLEHDSDSSEDESMPSSPPNNALPTFSGKQRDSITTTDYADKDTAAFYNDGYYLPPRSPARVVATTISVY